MVRENRDNDLEREVIGKILEALSGLTQPYVFLLVAPRRITPSFHPNVRATSLSFNQPYFETL